MTRSRSGHTAAELRERTERLVSTDEARAYLGTPISDREREDVLALVRWFRRRYPTGAERLGYIRRAFKRWRQTSETAAGD